MFHAKLPVTAALMLFLQLAIGQQNLDSLYQLGLDAMLQYRYAEAQPIFYECHRSDPSNQLYLEKLGQSYYHGGNLQEGRFYLREALKQDTANVQTLNLLVTIEEQLLEYRAALSRAETLIRLDSTNGYYHRLAGKLCESLRNAKAASSHYHHSLRLNPTDQLAVVAYCRLLVEAGHLPHADSLMEDALRKQQKNLRLLYESARLKYAIKRFDQVLPRFEVAFSLGDTNYTYLPLYAFSLAQMDSCSAALPWLRLLAEQSQDPNERVHYFMGHCYHVMDSLEQGFQQYELAVAAAESPNTGLYYQLMGDVMSQQKRPKQALKYYELAQENDNDDPLIFFYMADAFDQVYAKDKRRALDTFKQYLKHYDGKRPDLERHARQRVKELEQHGQQARKGG